MELKTISHSHLHHIKSPVSISVVVSSIIEVIIFLLEVDAAFAALLFQVAVDHTAHVDEAEKCHQNRDRGHRVVDNCFDVRARL